MKKALFSVVIAAVLIAIGYKILQGESNPAEAQNEPYALNADSVVAPIDDSEKSEKTISKPTEFEVENPFYKDPDVLTGRIRYAEHPEYFVKVDAQYCTQAMYMHTEAYQAFKKMHAAAKKDGVQLTIISAARNFESQKGIWERKWEANAGKDSVSRAKQILQYSSMPMSSRHHWGTDIDLNSLDNDYFKSGKGKKEYEWLVQNGPKFKFCQVYTENENDKMCVDNDTGNKVRREGYRLEKWHWSYMPVSSKLFENYNALVNHSMIKGFKGSELASRLKIKEHFVGGIADTCKCVQ
ncbi:MAG: M15 family metallopeptidase [Bacteroidia bacterium]